MQINPHGGVTDVPPEHAEAYSEMCRQFALGALNLYTDARSITLLRDMPVSLQINCFIVGVITGSLTPLLMLSKRGDDFEMAKHLQAAMPALIAQARLMAEDTLRNT